MKLPEYQEKLSAAVAALREAAKEDASEDALKAASKALTDLSKLTEAEIEPEVKEVEKVREVQVPATGEGEAATRLREVEAKLTETEGKLADETKRADDADQKADRYDRIILANKVLREAKVADEDSKLWLGDLIRESDEDAMKRVVEGKQAEVDRILARVREGLGGIEGAGARIPTPTGQERDPLADAGIDPLLVATPEPAAA